MRRQAQPPSTCPCPSPHQLCRHHPSKPVTTHLRAKGKFTADAAEKFRGLSRGLLPAEGEGDTESERARAGRRPCMLIPTLTCGDGEWRQGPGKGWRGRSYHQTFAVPAATAVGRGGDRIRSWPRPLGSEDSMPRPEHTHGQLWGGTGS